MKEIPAWKFWLAVMAVVGGIAFGLYLMSEVMGPSDEFSASMDELIEQSKLTKQ